MHKGIPETQVRFLAKPHIIFAESVGDDWIFAFGFVISAGLRQSLLFFPLCREDLVKMRERKFCRLGLWCLPLFPMNPLAPLNRKAHSTFQDFRTSKEDRRFEGLFREYWEKRNIWYLSISLHRCASQVYDMNNAVYTSLLLKRGIFIIRICSTTIVKHPPALRRQMLHTICRPTPRMHHHIIQALTCMPPCNHQIASGRTKSRKIIT